MYTLQRQQLINRPLRNVFPFFERPENLALITPPGLAFRLQTASPVKMRMGCIIDYEIRIAGKKIHWRTLISTYEPPWCFVDEQLRGPYGHWRHTHQFRDEGDSTRLLDEVNYALPRYVPSPVSKMINKIYLEPSLKRIFDYRQIQFSRFFGHHSASFSSYHPSLIPES